MSIYQPVRDERIRLLSVPRLSRYTTACAGDLKAAIDFVGGHGRCHRLRWERVECV